MAPWYFTTNPDLGRLFSTPWYAITAQKLAIKRQNIFEEKWHSLKGLKLKTVVFYQSDDVNKSETKYHCGKCKNHKHDNFSTFVSFTKTYPVL